VGHLPLGNAHLETIPLCISALAGISRAPSLDALPSTGKPHQENQTMKARLYNLLASIEQYVWMPQPVTDWIISGCERYCSPDIEPYF